MESIDLIIKKNNPKDKILRIKLEKIPTELYRVIDFEKIKNLCKNATHYEIKANIENKTEEKIIQNSRINSLSQEYKDFIKNKNLKEKKLLLELGMKYIEKIESKNENK